MSVTIEAIAKHLYESQFDPLEVTWENNLPESNAAIIAFLTPLLDAYDVTQRSE